MADLDRAIRARLDGFCVSDSCAEASKAAFLALLDLHKSADEQDAEWEHGPHWPCVVCHDGPWPCQTLRQVAEKLGVEHG